MTRGEKSPLSAADEERVVERSDDRVSPSPIFLNPYFRKHLRPFKRPHLNKILSKRPRLII
jgi:hypothetical protein